MCFTETASFVASGVLGGGGETDPLRLLPILASPRYSCCTFTEAGFSMETLPCAVPRSTRLFVGFLLHIRPSHWASWVHESDAACRCCFCSRSASSGLSLFTGCAGAPAASAPSSTVTVTATAAGVTLVSSHLYAHGAVEASKMAPQSTRPLHCGEVSLIEAN